MDSGHSLAEWRFFSVHMASSARYMQTERVIKIVWPPPDGKAEPLYCSERGTSMNFYQITKSLKNPRRGVYVAGRAAQKILPVPLARLLALGNQPTMRDVVDLPTCDGSGQACHPTTAVFCGKTYLACTPYPYGVEFYENPCLYVWGEDSALWGRACFPRPAPRGWALSTTPIPVFSCGGGAGPAVPQMRAPPGWENRTALYLLHRRRGNLDRAPSPGPGRGGYPDLSVGDRRGTVLRGTRRKGYSYCPVYSGQLGRSGEEDCLRHRRAGSELLRVAHRLCHTAGRYRPGPFYAAKKFYVSYPKQAGAVPPKAEWKSLAA